MPATFGKPRRRAAIGKMRDRIVLQRRDAVPPVSGSADFDLAFSDARSRWADVETVRGRAFFAGTNAGDVAVTHKVVIRYDPTITSEWWVLLRSGERLKIEDVENLDARNEWQRLHCTSRGLATSEASKA